MAENSAMSQQTAVRENIYAVIGLVVACVALELFAEIFLNKWAKGSPKNHAWMGAGVAFYVAIAVVYGCSLMYGQVTITNALWQCLALIFITIVGVKYFGNRPTLGQWVGLAIVTVGFTVLVSGSKEFGTRPWFTPVEF